MKLFRSTLLAASSMTLVIAGATALTAPGALADDAAFDYGDIQTIVALQDRGDDRRGGRGARGGRGGSDDGVRGGPRGGGRDGARSEGRGPGGPGGAGGRGPRGGDGARGDGRGLGGAGGGRGGRTDGPRQPDVRIPDETPGGDYRGRPGDNRGGEWGNGGARGGNRGGGDGYRGGNRGGNDGFRGGNRGGNDGFRGGNRGGNDGYRGGYRGGNDGYRGGYRGGDRFRDGNRGGRDGYRGGYRGNPRFDNRTPRYGGHRGGPRYDYRDQRRGRYIPPRRYRAYTGRYYRPARASWRYHTYYYDHGYDRYNWRYYDRACHANGESVIAGALLGALFGAAVADDDAAGALFGGFLGASVGYGLNDCDRGQYRYAVTYAFNNNSPYYWHNPYSGVRGVVYARDYYTYGSQRCRYGDAEIFMPDGSVEYDQVRMCQDRYGRWQVANYQ